MVRLLFKLLDFFNEIRRRGQKSFIFGLGLRNFVGPSKNSMKNLRIQINTSERELGNLNSISLGIGNVFFPLLDDLLDFSQHIDKIIIQLGCELFLKIVQKQIHSILDIDQNIEFVLNGHKFIIIGLHDQKLLIKVQIELIDESEVDFIDILRVSLNLLDFDSDLFLEVVDGLGLVDYELLLVVLGNREEVLVEVVFEESEISPDHRVRVEVELSQRAHQKAVYLPGRRGLYQFVLVGQVLEHFVGLIISTVFKQQKIYASFGQKHHIVHKLLVNPDQHFPRRSEIRIWHSYDRSDSFCFKDNKFYVL